ncbi:MAG: choice-of-anchor B family protein [Planctomycetota bacterium]
MLRHSLFGFLLIASSVAQAVVPAGTLVDGDAGVARRAGVVAGHDGAVAAGPDFSSFGVAMLDYIPLADFPDAQERGADLWGYESPSGRQYGLVMFRKGTAIVEVTDPENAVIVDYVDGSGIDRTWRDAKVFGEYAYIVTDGDGVGLQIVDLSDIDNGVATLVTNSDLGSDFSTAHNIALNEESGYAYLCGGNLANGGIVALDLSDPANPTIAGAWTENYIHDLQVVTYKGGKYDGREIAFCYGGSSGMFIVDVTEKLNMFTRSNLTYMGLSYCHQGWLSEDRRHTFIGDELDEFFGEVLTTTTYVANVENLDLPFIVTSFNNGVPATDHNLFTRGDFMYAANYTSGVRIFDISDVNNASEIGYFDSYPPSDDVDATFPGAWAAYVGFDAPIVLLNDRDYGFFVLDASAALSGEVPQAARPMADAYMNKNCDIASCSNDGECAGESACLPQSDGSFPGTCYVPRNRYLAVRANSENASLNTARRISVMTGNGPVVLGWVGEPVAVDFAGPECSSLGNSQLVARVSDTPYYTNWSQLSSEVVLLGDCHISPGYSYEVEAITNGADIGDEAAYSSALVLATASTYGDVTSGGAVASPPDGLATLIDVQACILGFQNTQSAPKSWLDLTGDVPDGTVNLSDAFSAVLGFQAQPYGGDDPCTCGGLPGCQAK